jgi:hypothetical protein
MKKVKILAGVFIILGLLMGAQPAFMRYPQTPATPKSQAPPTRPRSITNQARLGIQC